MRSQRSSSTGSTSTSSTARLLNPGEHQLLDPQSESRAASPRVTVRCNCLLRAGTQLTSTHDYYLAFVLHPLPVHRSVDQMPSATPVGKTAINALQQMIKAIRKIRDSSVIHARHDIRQRGDYDGRIS